MGFSDILKIRKPSRHALLNTDKEWCNTQKSDKFLLQSTSRTMYLNWCSFASTTKWQS